MPGTAEQVRGETQDYHRDPAVRARVAGWIMLELHRPQADTIEYVKRAYARATVLLSPDRRDGQT